MAKLFQFFQRFNLYNSCDQGLDIELLDVIINRNVATTEINLFTPSNLNF